MTRDQYDRAQILFQSIGDLDFLLRCDISKRMSDIEEIFSCRLTDDLMPVQELKEVERALRLKVGAKKKSLEEALEKI